MTPATPAAPARTMAPAAAMAPAIRGPGGAAARRSERRQRRERRLRPRSPERPGRPRRHRRRRGRSAAGSGPSLSAQVTLTIPWATQQGGSAPGEAGGFGLLDPETARDLAAAAARHPDTRWCYTALHPDGTAAAHACAPGPHPGGPPDPRTLKFSTVIRGPCDHAQAQAGYRPGRKLRHLVTARNATCTAPGCGQPAGPLRPGSHQSLASWWTHVSL